MQFDQNADHYLTRRTPVFAQNIVATSQPVAAQAGIRMLHAGGNAVDAALATAITLTVVEPTGNGLGSDAFAIVWDGTRLHGLNASGRSPAGWTPSRFSHLATMPSVGWESVTVPGAVSAWVELSARFGRLPFEKLFEPAIGYARNGFLLTPNIAKSWETGASRLLDQPGFADCFVRGGRVPVAGELVRNLDLANTLELIAQSKGEAFYRGDLARRIAAFSREHGAVLTMTDLEEHTADWCGTISGPFKDNRLHEIPPNGQGIVALMALGMLAHTDIADLAADSVEAIHLQVEAIKLALADVERYVGDPTAMRMGHEALLDPDYLSVRAKRIDRNSAGDPGAGAPNAGGTVYLTTADRSGMMVSYIQSNFVGFGSGVVVPATGIHLQNRGFGFTLERGHPNEVAPRKRPFHTIIPGFALKDGKPSLSFGVMGGPMQAQGHLQMLLRTQVFGQNPQTASDAPRWRFISGRKLAVEAEMSRSVVEGLRILGHEIQQETPDQAFAFGGAQLIQRLDHGYAAGSDHRKDGAAIGY